MGYTDIPPPDRPTWLIPLSTIFLAIGILLWLASYVLMSRRALASHATPVSLLALSLNLSWELVFVCYVCEPGIERLGFCLWLLFEMPLVRATLKAGAENPSPTALFVGNGVVLAILTAFGVAGHITFVTWWLAEPGRGHGDKTGKSWKGIDQVDTTELAYWTAGFAQLVMSGGCVGMVLERGHSGGQSYAIWLTRSLGTQFGLTANSGLLWWYWPEAHGYFVNPFALFLLGSSTLLDLVYGPLLWWVKQNETVLPDGRCVAGGVFAAGTGAEKKKKKKQR